MPFLCLFCKGVNDCFLHKALKNKAFNVVAVIHQTVLLE